jgi:hypothetical protein
VFFPITHRLFRLGQDPGALHEALETRFLGDCERGVVLMNSNIHTAINDEAAFHNATGRFETLGGLIDHARSKCGRRVFWRSPNRLCGEWHTRVNPSGRLTYGDMA